MPRRTQKDLVASLTAAGLRFRGLEVVTEGRYPIADADWNYKDVPHFSQVHGNQEYVTGVVESDAMASVNLQRFLGLRMPVVVSHYESEPDRQTYFFTLFTYTVICETSFEQGPSGETVVITRYEVGSTRFWMLAYPIIAWALRRNYAVLMSEDIPLRDRRLALRDWGYSFQGDGEPRQFVDSLLIERDRVELADVPRPAAAEVALTSLDPDRPFLWGRDDHLGLRIDRAGDRIRCFPRLCAHEGASLDGAPVAGGCITCPWHGRKHYPVAQLQADHDGETLDTGMHEISIVDGIVRLRATAPHGADTRIIDGDR